MIPDLDEVLGSSDRGRYLVADVGAAHLAFELGDVLEVFPLARLARVPWAPPFVHGAVYRNGRVVTVIDPARFLDLEGPPVTAGGPAVALLLERPDQALALRAFGVQVIDARQACRSADVKIYLREPGWLRASLSTPAIDFHLLEAEALARGVAEAF